MRSARSGGQYEEAFKTVFEPIEWLPFDEAVATRAVDVQRQMAQGTDGNHSRPAADYLIAAAAEAGGKQVTLWCFDKDLALICEHTGQPYEAEVSS